MSSTPGITSPPTLDIVAIPDRVQNPDKFPLVFRVTKTTITKGLVARLSLKVMIVLSVVKSLLRELIDQLVKSFLRVAVTEMAANSHRQLTRAGFSYCLEICQ